MSNKKAVVILSGGQDSTTCLFWAVKKFGKENVMGLSFSYGQRHSSELDAATHICEKNGIKHLILPTDIYSRLEAVPFMNEVQCSLLNDDLEIKTEDGSEFPNSFVPYRNLLFLINAAIAAQSFGAENLVIGVSQIDYSGYPDCRAEFIYGTQELLKTAINGNVIIHTPLIHLTKAKTWEMALDLGILDLVYNETVTCYNGIKGKGCGKCPACELRKQGYLSFLESQN
jgi:queuosine biosynthesis protein QueC